MIGVLSQIVQLQMLGNVILGLRMNPSRIPKQMSMQTEATRSCKFHLRFWASRVSMHPHAIASKIWKGLLLGL